MTIGYLWAHGQIVRILLGVRDFVPSIREAGTLFRIVALDHGASGKQYRFTIMNSRNWYQKSNFIYLLLRSFNFSTYSKDLLYLL